MKFRKNIAIDFDGVLNEYKGFDEKNLYNIRSGAKQFLERLNEDYDIIIYSRREPHYIIKWLQRYHISHLIKDVTKQKPAAVIYIDDRAIRFNGNYNEVLDNLDIKTYWEKELENKRKK